MLIVITGFSLQWGPPPNVMHQASTVAPYLEPVKYNTTVFVGQTAYLACRGVCKMGETKYPTA
jgi:hypothetical protein